jgi:hypothetical protein
LLLANDVRASNAQKTPHDREVLLRGDVERRRSTPPFPPSVWTAFGGVPQDDAEWRKLENQQENVRNGFGSSPRCEVPH